VENNLQNIKKPFSKCQRAGNGQAPQTGRLSQLLYEQGNRKCISEVGRSNWGLLRKKIDRTSVEEVLPMLLSGSPYWTLSELLREILQLKMLD